MWKRATIAIGGALLLAIGVVIIGGSLMPRTHVAASRVVIDGPIDSVWAAIRDFQSLPHWWYDVERVERLADTEGAEIWTLHTSSGPMTIAVESTQPPRQLVTRIVADADAPFGGTWTYDLVPTAGGTRVTVTEDGYINSLVFRFVANVALGLHGTADSYLEDLSRRFGGGSELQHVGQE